MTDEDQPDITAMLTAWTGGDADALNRLIEFAYPTLRAIAHQHLVHRRAGESLVSASLTNEAYLKLLHAGRIDCRDRAHFLAVCSQMMRRILMDHARRRGCGKRGGSAVRVALDLAVEDAQTRGVDLLRLDEALNGLAALDARKSRVVELRYFGGLSIEETARVLLVSPDTVKRDWRLARAWLLAQLRR